VLCAALYITHTQNSKKENAMYVIYNLYTGVTTNKLYKTHGAAQTAFTRMCAKHSNAGGAAQQNPFYSFSIAENNYYNAHIRQAQEARLIK
jgi:hypothetical protein